MFGKIKRRATRMVIGMSHWHIGSVRYEVRLKTLELISLEKKRLQGGLMLNVLEGTVQHLFTVVSAERRRRHSMKMFKPRAEIPIRQSFFSHR